MKHIKLFENFKSEEEPSLDIWDEFSSLIGYDVRLAVDAHNIIIKGDRYIQEWFDKEIEKEQPNFPLIREIIGLGYKFKNLGKRYSIYWASRENKPELIKLLLENGEDINSRSSYDKDKTPLIVATEYGNKEAVKVLLENGADIELDATGKEMRAIHFASENNHSEILSLLIEYGAEKEAKDKYEKTPLHYAAMYNNVECAKILIDADVIIDEKGEDNWTALHYASKTHSLKVAKLLLKADADINAVTEGGLTSLHIASISAGVSIIKLLIKHNANLEIQTKYDKFTALHYAARSNNNPYNKMSVELLLEAGADKKALNQKNETPWDMADYYVKKNCPELDPDYKEKEI